MYDSLTRCGHVEYILDVTAMRWSISLSCGVYLAHIVTYQRTCRLFPADNKLALMDLDVCHSPEWKEKGREERRRLGVGGDDDDGGKRTR